MKIYFARHGESQANLLKVISNRKLPHGLTKKGQDQARQLAERLRRIQINRIYTSPLLRAVQTGEIIADQLKVECQPVDGLREYDCGIAEGRSDEAAWQLWQNEYDAWVFNHDYDHQIAGGESYPQVRQRFLTFIEGLVRSFACTEAQILCISHGGLYSVMFPLIMHNVDAEMMVNYGFDYASCIVAEHTPDGFVCIEWNGKPVQAV